MVDRDTYIEEVVALAENETRQTDQQQVVESINEIAQSRRDRGEEKAADKFQQIASREARILGDAQKASKGVDLGRKN